MQHTILLHTDCITCLQGCRMIQPDCFALRLKRFIHFAYVDVLSFDHASYFFSHILHRVIRSGARRTIPERCCRLKEIPRILKGRHLNAWVSEANTSISSRCKAGPVAALPSAKAAKTSSRMTNPRACRSSR